ncbi:growth arrest-specific protein 2 [Trichonephila inaurata madagascariensis]|uniref:Growth arrest-specific protein 2 n=1 Tax=Trichonephila inaurata madagascariensis TaxID=2747483 RepID=A0A8X7C8I2_9ARAC|nr:growth arrest-specific protein 2 [Trichonephila inaurata madagascariensis]
MIIYGKEKEILKAQKRSLAAWINNTLGATLVDAESLIPKLSTGVILCKLAKCIQTKVDETRGYYGKAEHVLQLKYWESAKRETFFARDNAEMFIRWCKSFGVRDAVLFESDGLVLQTQPRTVILCLLELSRLASKYGVLLPPPIQVPQAATLALEEEEISECSEDEFFYATTIPSPTKFQRWDSGCSSGPRSPSPNSIYSKNSSPSSSLKRSGIPLRKKEKNVVVVVRSRCDNPLQKEEAHQKKTSPRISSPSLRRSLSSVRSDTISSRMRSNPNLYRSTSSIASTKSLMEKPESRPSDYVPIGLQRRRSALDKRVLEVARKYLKDETKIRRVSEGHYNFSGKNVYLRIVRGSNVVVRLGGGWDTLEHFLSTLDFNKPTAFYKQPRKYEHQKPIQSVKISPY